MSSAEESSIYNVKMDSNEQFCKVNNSSDITQPNQCWQRALLAGVNLINLESIMKASAFMGGSENKG